MDNYLAELQIPVYEGVDVQKWRVGQGVEQEVVAVREKMTKLVDVLRKGTGAFFLTASGWATTMPLSGIEKRVVPLGDGGGCKPDGDE